MRNLNLKFISVIIFAITFLVGGFFINMGTVFAVTSIASATISPSINYSLENSDYILSIQRDNGSTSTGGIGSIEIIVPTEYGTPTINVLTIACNPSCTKNWISDGFSSGRIKIHSDGTDNKLRNSDKIDIAITSVSPANPKSNPGYEWTTSAFTNLYYDGTLYTISIQPTVDIVAPLSSDKNIASFSFPDLGAGVITGIDIAVAVPFGTNVTALVPAIVLSGGTINPLSGVAQDFTSPKTYTVTAANSSTKTYTITVTPASDGVATAFNNISTTLTSAGIANNLNTVTGSNYTNFSGLYFEKSIDGVKMGKITFTSALDLSKDATKTFLQNLGTKMDMAQAGIIGLDFSDNTPDILTDDPSLKGVSATIEFYGLDKLGFDASSTSDEINAKLIAYDDDENILNMSDLVDTPGIYTPPVGVCEVGGVCYVFSVDVNHFTKYKIDNATETTPNINGNANLGGNTTGVVITNPDQAVTVTVGSGTTNPTIDVSAFISLVEGEKTGTLPEINITSDVADVAIPDNTIVTGPADWNGVIDAPTSGTPAGGNAPAGFNVGDTVISIGSDSGTLVFDKPVTILLAGVTGTVGYRPALSNTWQTITNVCGGSYNTPTAPTAPGECAISNGTDTKIVTYHFTSFGGLDAVSHSNNNGSRPATLAVSAITTVGCNPKSGDLYDINTGKRCTNNTSVINSITTKEVSEVNEIIPKPKELVVESIQSVDELIETPVVEETPENNLTASVGRVSSLITGPISIWTILLIIVILLGGGYGIYSLNKKQKK